MTVITLAFDRSSVRTTDKFSRLHIETANISKAIVNPYYGREIPNWQTLGLAADRVYMMLRHPDELAKAAATFNNLPVLDQHVPVHAADDSSHHPYAVVGSTGTDAAFDGCYLQNSMVVWAKPSIDRINDKSQRELSSSYSYDADMTAGVHEGLRFDGIMRNIVGNHVALVKIGRAGRDVLVGDAELEVMPVALNSRKALMLHGALNALMRPLLAADKALDLSAALEPINADNLADNGAALAASIVTATAGNLAADKSLTVDDVKAVIDEIVAVKLAADESDNLVAPAAPIVVAAPTIVATPPAAPAALAAQPTGVTQAAMDAAIAATQEATVARMNAVRTAEREVHPFIGEIKVALDSAPDVYKLALDHLKVDLAGVDKSAYRAVLMAQPKPDATTPRPRVALDKAAANDFATRFPNRAKLIRG